MVRFLQFSAVISALFLAGVASADEQPNDRGYLCSSLFGAAQGTCFANWQQRQAQNANQQALLQQQQAELQRQQIEGQRLQNEILRRQLAKESAPSAAGDSINPVTGATEEEMAKWKAANPWFGTDQAKTEFAKSYAKKLHEESPKLRGSDFLDIVSAKVANSFGR